MFCKGIGATALPVHAPRRRTRRLHWLRWPITCGVVALFFGTIGGRTSADEVTGYYGIAHQCLAGTDARVCERAYLLATELKAQFRISWGIARLDPRVEAIVAGAVGAAGEEGWGQRVTPTDVPIVFAAEQFVFAVRAGNYTALKTGNRVALSLYFGQALRAGNEVLASTSESPIALRIRRRIRKLMPYVRDWVRGLEKACPGKTLYLAPPCDS